MIKVRKINIKKRDMQKKSDELICCRSLSRRYAMYFGYQASYVRRFLILQSSVSAEERNSAAFLYSILYSEIPVLIMSL